MALFAGILISSSIFLIFFLSIPSKDRNVLIDLGLDGEYHKEMIYRVLPVYRFTFIMAVSTLFTGLCIKFFRRYSVNYIYIFGIDPANRLNQYEFYKIFLFLATLWMACSLLELIAIKGFIPSLEHGKSSYFALVLLSVFMILTIQPFNCLYKKFRMEFLYSLLQNLISPFGYVRFKDFFLGDIMTSMVKPLIDMYFIQCFITSGAWKDPMITDTCLPSNDAVLFVSYLPFHIRFFQCINRYYYTRQFNHILNAGKYMSTIVVIVITYFKNTYMKYEYLYLGLYVFSTMYSFIWDILMDWGLMRRTKPGKIFLRDRLKYPPYLYYFSMVTNFILRFAWTLTLLPDWYFSQFFKETGGLFMLLSLAECYRRA